MDKNAFSDSEDDAKKRDGKKDKKIEGVLSKSLSRFSGTIFRSQTEPPDVPRLSLSSASSADDMPTQADYPILRKSVEHVSYNYDFVEGYDAFFKAMIPFLNECLELLDLLDPITSNKQYRLSDFVEQLKLSSGDKYLGSSFAVKEFNLLIEKVKSQKLFISSDDKIEASKLLGVLKTIISRYADTDLSPDNAKLPNNTFGELSALDINVYRFLQSKIIPKDSGSRHYDDVVPNPTVQAVLSEDDVNLLMKCNAYCLPGISSDVMRKSSEIFRAGFLSEIEKRSPALKLIRGNLADVEVKFSDIDEFNFYFLTEIIPIVQQLFQRIVDVGEISNMVAEAVKKRFTDHAVMADKRGVDKVVKKMVDSLIEKMNKYFATHHAKYAHLSELNNSKRTRDQYNAESNDILSQKFVSLKETLMNPMLIEEINIWKKTISLIQSRVPNHLNEHANRLLVIHDALNELLKMADDTKFLFQKLKAHVQDQIGFIIQLNEAANSDLEVSLVASSDNQDVNLMIRNVHTGAVLPKEGSVYTLRIPSGTSALNLFCEMNSSLVTTHGSHPLKLSVQNVQAVIMSNIKKSQMQTKRIELNHQYKTVQFHIPSAQSFNVLSFGSGGAHFGSVSLSLHGIAELSSDKVKDYLASLKPNLNFTYLQLMPALGVIQDYVSKSPRLHKNRSGGGLAQLAAPSPRRRNSIADIKEGSPSQAESREGTPRSDLKTSVDPSTGRPKSGKIFTTPGINDGRSRACSSPRAGDRADRKSDRPDSRSSSIDLDSPGRLESPSREYGSGADTPPQGSSKLPRRGFGKLDQGSIGTHWKTKRDMRVKAPAPLLRANSQIAEETADDDIKKSTI